MEEIHENNPKKTRQGIINNNKVDRLSLLPDFILIDIISLLDLNAAAQTSVLSHRWRHLWTHITPIHMDCFSHTGWPSYIHKYNFQSLTTIFTHILQQIDSPKITSFRLGCPASLIEDENIQCSSYMRSWVPLICSKKPEQIKVTLGGFKDFVVMPMCVFQCTSLVNLQLSGRFRCMLDGVFSISLPHLKKLELGNIDIDPNLLGRIIKNCPLLETFYLHLELNENKEQLVLDLSGKNLKLLSINIDGSSSHQSKILIDAPNLEKIILQGCFAIYRFVHKLSYLKTAAFGFYDFPGEDDYGSNEISELVGGICNVGFLRIMEGISILNPVYHSRPDVFEKFTNLTKLSLTCDWTRMEEIRTAPLPVCLFRWLKFVELLEIGGEVIEFKLVKYILRHGNVLETLIIEICHSSGIDRNDLWSEFKFCDALFDMAAETSSCSVQFQGNFITASSSGYRGASSSGYRGASHSCQINYNFLEPNDIGEISDYSSEDSE